MGLNRLFFITGRGRSGTWLLKTILDAHPNICVTPESLFCILLKRKYSRERQWDRRAIANFCRDLVNEQKVPSWWHLSHADLLDDLLNQSAAGQVRSYEDACRCVHNLYAAGSGKDLAWVGGKNPEYSFFHADLLEMFPESRFIHMVRDPRDNIHSFLNVSFDLNDPVALAYRWQAYNDSACSFQQQNPRKILVVRFEDLIENQESELKKILSFLELSYDESILTYYTKASNVFSFNRRISEPLTKERVYRWKQEQPLADAVHRVAARGIAAFRYEPGPTRTRLSLRHRLSILLGVLTTTMERLVFALPLSLTLPLLATYRKVTGTLEEKDRSRGSHS